uniref:Uncharacterized protein n=1 Tax=Cryptosporidium parvum TaxID=5807 RepID=F0X592_CRYPV
MMKTRPNKPVLLMIPFSLVVIRNGLSFLNLSFNSIERFWLFA